jgi:hypothetical protein
MIFYYKGKGSFHYLGDMAYIHKYEHLLVECGCEYGSKIHKLLPYEEENKCTDCSFTISICHCGKRYDASGSVYECPECKTDGYLDGIMSCYLCGVESVYLDDSDPCVYCVYLEERGSRGEGPYTEGFPLGEERGSCIHCGNRLRDVSEGAVCLGCYIEPLDYSPVKPVKKGNKEMAGAVEEEKAGHEMCIQITEEEKAEVEKKRKDIQIARKEKARRLARERVEKNEARREERLKMLRKEREELKMLEEERGQIMEERAIEDRILMEGRFRESVGDCGAILRREAYNQSAPKKTTKTSGRKVVRLI